MIYTIAVPEPIQARIASWGLSLEAEDSLYAELEGGLTQEELDRLWRHPGPGFTFIWNLDFQDPLIFGITHFFTLWLVHGPRPDHLYIYQCDYDLREGWESDDQDDGYDPDPYSDER